MGEHPVADVIRREAGDPKATFVFPSDVAATLWLETALRVTGAGTIAANRFIAWDRFKEDAVQASVAGKSPVSSVIRKLYARELAERNRQAAETGEALFRALIPASRAAESATFAAWIARLLPQLAVWERKQAKRLFGGPDTGRPATRETPDAATSDDPEDDDLAFLKDDYGRFLDSSRLFEPSWQLPPLKDAGKRYFVFFPELLEDFDDYEPLIRHSSFISLIPAEGLAERNTEKGAVPGDAPDTKPDVAAPDTATRAGNLTLRAYGDTRAELKGTLLEIEALIDAGVPPEAIAVSAPNVEEIEPYLLREFDLRGIPYEYRSGFPLGAQGGGRTFALIQAAVGDNFSFAAVKALLLDRLIPWKDRASAEGLVSFGIRNHCVSSWAENGRPVDVWEEAFRMPTKGQNGDRELRDWYRRFRDGLRRIAEAPTFTATRVAWFAFRRSMLDMESLAPADDAVFARCVEELTALAALEPRFPALIPTDPFAFFVSTIAEKKYVPRRAASGVSVFPFRVAAGTPFPHHFILDASQDNATVLYRQLPFLRQDKRLRLKLDDLDASWAFFAAYAACPYADGQSSSALPPGARFSFAIRSFTGYRVAHGAFARVVPAAPSPDDAYAREKAWLGAISATADSTAGPTEATGSPSDAQAIRPAFPARLYPRQATGFAVWDENRQRRAAEAASYLDLPYGDRLPALTSYLIARQIEGDNLKVSQADLQPFAVCNARWFLARGLGLKAESGDAELLNERNLGLLYHDVFRRLYGEIRETGGGFQSGNKAAYRERARELAQTAAAGNVEFQGPLAAPLVATLAERVADGISSILDQDAKFLDGWLPDWLEDELTLARDGLLFKGRLDRISRFAADGSLVLIDYKSGGVPKPADYRDSEAQPIVDFQMPIYLYLAEESPNSPYRGAQIREAWFASLKEGRFKPIVTDGEGFPFGKSLARFGTRDEFETAIQAMQREASRFAQAVRAADFTRPARLDRAECNRCDFRKICRYTYAETLA